MVLVLGGTARDTLSIVLRAFWGVVFMVLFGQRHTFERVFFNLGIILVLGGTLATHF